MLSNKYGYIGHMEKDCRFINSNFGATSIGMMCYNCYSHGQTTQNCKYQQVTSGDNEEWNEMRMKTKKNNIKHILIKKVEKIIFDSNLSNPSQEGMSLN